MERLDNQERWILLLKCQKVNFLVSFFVLIVEFFFFFFLAIASGVPTAASDGTITMVVHQVNQDGAGPFTCEVRSFTNTTTISSSSFSLTRIFLLSFIGGPSWYWR